MKPGARMGSSIYVGAILTKGEGEVLLEEEGLNKQVYYSLPQARIEGRLRLDDAIRDEIKGKLGIECELEHLVGIYTGFPVRSVLHFMFKAKYLRTSDLIEPRALWMPLERVRALRGEEVVNSAILKAAIGDWAAGKAYGLDILTNQMYGKGLKE
jgi:hypothetical protein